MAENDSIEMTIEELSAQSGVSTRNIRAFQSKLLLPPPDTYQRVGYYNEGHLARLKLITSLQNQGFSLSGIGELLSAWEKGKSLDEVLGFESALTSQWGKKPKRYTADELKEVLLPIKFSEKLISHLESLGLLNREEDGYRVHPQVLEMAVESVKAGVPLEVIFQEADVALNGLKKMADHLISVYLRHVWEPFVQEGQPDEKLASLAEIIQRLRVLATNVTATLVGDALETAIEQATGNYMRKSQSRKKEK